MTTTDFVREFQQRKQAEEAERQRKIAEAVKPLDERAAARAAAAEEAERQRADAQKQAAQERAAAAEDIERRADLTAWLAAGGDEASHAAVWPDRWRRILAERADAKRREATNAARAFWQG